ncbi:MAG TPA: UTP--glucose-1-phosphate uridylyltransferase [Verrucomicrobiales bacterium]|nr:UTP--glucose-1-phosphate uridylyltransferase [Verrucomicrobiales bacterium]
MSRLVQVIRSADPAERNRSLEALCGELTLEELQAECAALDQFRREATNLYEKVRALYMLYAIYRFYLPGLLGDRSPGKIQADGYAAFLDRRFPEAIACSLRAAEQGGLNDTLCSCLAAGYEALGLQLLRDQVRASVRSVRGNQWIFRTGHALSHPLRIRPELLRVENGLYPVAHEKTAVRLDLTHSGWSDIFFLGMDYPEGARVLNISVDLGVHGRDTMCRPPVEACLRVIEDPVIRLCSIDLGSVVEVRSMEEIFDFGRDYLGLLKAALIASGLVPSAMEGAGQRLEDLLEVLAGPGRGIELVSSVNDIPKGSRLAVSTNLLGCLIAVCMRATGQTESLEGPLGDGERRTVASRAILGEWLGGSGGGWQDSGGVWPGIKIISGCAAGEDDPEYGISRGRLLPRHEVLSEEEVTRETRAALQESLVLVHGGMAQNVGPVLEMVTEKYLLRLGNEWEARQESLRLFDRIVAALRAGDLEELARCTDRHFDGPLRTIIPWVNNAYTETLRRRMAREFGDDYRGFLMLGGMSGGGMGFWFAPGRAEGARDRVREILLDCKREFERSLPFAMDPVVYRYRINGQGSAAQWKRGASALMPTGYYPLILPVILQSDPRGVSAARRAEAERFYAAAKEDAELRRGLDQLFAELFPASDRDGGREEKLDAMLDALGFDRVQHERIRQDLIGGRIGLAQNRLALTVSIEDVEEGEAMNFASEASEEDRERGEAMLAAGEVAVVTLAGGAASRWTEGAGVVKALHPFCRMGEAYRTFVEAHLAKCRRTGERCGVYPPYVITTSFLTEAPVRGMLARRENYGYPGLVRVSRGQSTGLRLIPMERDLRFQWEQMPVQQLDERAQKMRESAHEALIAWARAAGEGADYRDNRPGQCLHPVGHWYEIPNLLLNGTLRDLLEARPQLRTLLVHNVDTLGAWLDPALCGLFRRTGACLLFEVIPRRIEDVGGGLAKVDGRLRLIEGMALPREDDEFSLSYYNSATNWVDIDRLLAVFGLKREDLDDAGRIREAVRRMAQRVPAYITLKEVKKRWGQGQEDVYPTAQFERLWGDMTALPAVDTRFVVVPRVRGQQLKAQAQLDGWFRDGSAAIVESLCAWG